MRTAPYLVIGAGVIWLFMGILFGVLSAIGFWLFGKHQQGAKGVLGFLGKHIGVEAPDAGTGGS